jgi:hypothetical protein
MFKRIIKDEKSFKSKDIVTVPINKNIIHPITLNKINTEEFKNPICLTKMYISNNKLNTFSNYICNGENKYKQYIQLPPVSLNASNLLEIYDINSIDELNEWIKNNMFGYTQITIIRVISSWIINNSDTLKLYKKKLGQICLFLISNKYEIKESKDEEKILRFIDDWIDNYTIDKDSNIIDDLLIYIKNNIKL